MSLLSFNDLTIGYDNNIVMSNLSFAIEKGDNGLVETATGQGIPLDNTTTAYAEAKLVGTRRTGAEKNNLGGVAQMDGLVEESDQGGVGRGNGVTSGIFNHYKLKDTTCVVLQLLARHTVVERLYARWESAFGFALALGIDELPSVDQLTGGD